jgi:transposase
MNAPPQVDAGKLETMGPEQLRTLATQLLERIGQDSQAIRLRDTKIEKLTFEIAQLRRQRYGVKSEQLDAEQRRLFDENIDEDIGAVEEQLRHLIEPPAPDQDADKRVPKRAPLPAHLPRLDHHHEPESTVCGCGCQMKRIGEDISEKLDYAPGDFTVQRHIRGKWACGQCKTLVQAPVEPEVIDKGIPTAALLTQVLVAKYADHVPLYRQEAIFGRAGMTIPRSTLAAWVGQCGVRLQPLVDALRGTLLNLRVLHADETPIRMLAPGTGKTHRAYIWSYAAGEFDALRAVVYEFTPGRSGENARLFLGDWKGSLVCDDYVGYKALFAGGITEAGCMAHARRKFVELQQGGASIIATQALGLFGQLYGVERDIKTLPVAQRLEVRQRRAKPIADALHSWLVGHRLKIPDGTGTANAIDYSLKRWTALTRYLGDPELPIDNNHDERQIRPWATGRKNWLFAGTLAAGQRAAAIMSLIQSAKLNGHDPYAYLRDVLTRLPTHKASQIDELLPHRWALAKP